MTWLNNIFGTPNVINSHYQKLSNLSVDIDDFYTTTLKYPNNIIGNLTIEVLSRPLATRELRIIGEKGIIKFSSDTNSISIFTNLVIRLKK